MRDRNGSRPPEAGPRALSRRRFLRAAAGVGGLLLAGCGAGGTAGGGRDGKKKDGAPGFRPGDLAGLVLSTSMGVAGQTLLVDLGELRVLGAVNFSAARSGCRPHHFTMIPTENPHAGFYGLQTCNASHEAFILEYVPRDPGDPRLGGEFRIRANLAERYGVPAVIAGFELVDILGALHELLGQVVAGEARVVNAYPRLVREEEPISWEAADAGRVPANRMLARLNAREQAEAETRPVRYVIVLGEFPGTRGDLAVEAEDALLPPGPLDVYRLERGFLGNHLSLARNRSLMGRVCDVMVDGRSRGGLYLGRTEGDAPEVDGRVYFRAGTSLAPGSVVRVRITRGYSYDLAGVAEP